MHESVCVFLRAVTSATGWPFFPVEHLFLHVHFIVVLPVFQINDDDDDRSAQETIKVNGYALCTHNHKTLSKLMMQSYL